MWSPKNRRSNKLIDLACCIACRSMVYGRLRGAHKKPGYLWIGNSPRNESTADASSRHGVRCIDEARQCDVLLFVNGEDEQACGALIEACAALAVGRQLFVVWPDASTFSHRPNCQNFSALADAIAAIVAMQAGKATRGYSASISGTNSP